MVCLCARPYTRWKILIMKNGKHMGLQIPKYIREGFPFATVGIANICPTPSIKGLYEELTSIHKSVRINDVFVIISQIHCILEGTTHGTIGYQMKNDILKNPHFSFVLYTYLSLLSTR